MEHIRKNRGGSKRRAVFPVMRTVQNKSFFNRIADGFGTERGITGLVRARDEMRKKIGEMVLYNGNILDVGVGNGLLFQYLKKKIPCTGVDIAETMLEKAGQNASRYGIPFTPVIGNAVSLPFSDSSFDTVICADVLHHIPAPMMYRACDELMRVVRPGGQILLETKNKLNVLLCFAYWYTAQKRNVTMNPANPFAIQKYFARKNCAVKRYFVMPFLAWLSPFILFDIRAGKRLGAPEHGTERRKREFPQ